MTSQRTAMGRRNSRMPVALFARVCLTTKPFFIAKPEITFTALIRAMMPVQIHSHLPTLISGMNSTNHMATKMMSARVSSLSPRRLTVPVKRATAPSRTSDSPHSRYSVQNTAGEDCTKGRAMAIGILARVIASGINRFILLIDDYSRSGRGNHQHSVVCSKHLVVDIDAHYGVCTQTAGTLSHFVHSLLTCLDQLALI